MAIFSLDKIKASQEWFKKAINAVKSTINGVLKPEMPFSESLARLTPRYIGRMVMFYYDPKWKDDEKVLPYYDTFPLVILVNLKKDRFHGLNLHYLPPALRVQLLAALMRTYENKHLDERRRLEMDYQMLKSTRRLRYFAPCFKEYIYSHVRSKYNIVKPAEWHHVSTLRLERFVRATNQRVWEESRRKIGL